MRWLTFSSNLVKEINTLPEFFLFQRFPEQVKRGFLIEGGTLRLASRGDSLRRKIELKKTLDGICPITVYLHLSKLLFPASLACFWILHGDQGYISARSYDKSFKAILAVKWLQV